MGKLVFITGQLVMEIRARQARSDGSRRLVEGTSIVPGGRSYRQALSAKKQGYNVILLGRVGDDHYGQTILHSLAGLGVSTQFIQASPGEYTGLSFEVTESAGAAPLEYFDPGASVGPGDFQLPIQRYLPLCDAVLINQWFNPETCLDIARQAAEHHIPTLYVCSAPPRDCGDLVVDHLFLDASRRPDAAQGGHEAGGPGARRATYIWGGGLLRVLGAQGREMQRLPLDPEADADRVVTLLMGAVAGGRELDASAFEACALKGEGS
jgi:hypothetical protein